MSSHQRLSHESEEPSSALLGSHWTESLQIHNLFIKTNYVCESNFKQHRKLLQGQSTLTFSHISSEITPPIQLSTHSLQWWLLQAFFCVFSEIFTYFMSPVSPILPVTMLLYLTVYEFCNYEYAPSFNTRHSLLFKRPRGGGHSVLKWNGKVCYSSLSFVIGLTMWTFVPSLCGIYSYRINPRVSIKYMSVGAGPSISIFSGHQGCGSVVALGVLKTQVCFSATTMK